MPRHPPTLRLCTSALRADIPANRRANRDPVQSWPAATAQAAECSGVVIRPVQCLANCTRGLSAAVRCNGSWTYVFGGLDSACGPALVDGARLLASASDGIMPWRGRPQALKRGLIARVPPLDFKEFE